RTIVLIKLSAQANNRRDSIDCCYSSSDASRSRRALGGAGGRSGITVTYRGAFAVQCAQWHGDLSASVGGNSDKIIFRNIVGQGQFDCGATKLIFLAIFVGIPSSVDRSGFLNVSHLDGCSSRLWIFCHGVVQRGEVKRHVLACSQRSLGRDTNIGLAFL